MPLTEHDIARLGPEAQAQIRARLGKAQKRSKYNNTRTPRTMPNGKVRMFDSKHEAERYDELMLMLKAGKIRDLRLQQTFTLAEGYVTAEGDVVKPMTYKADFVYYEPVDNLWDGSTCYERVVEDAKGVRTKEYTLKKKLMLDVRGIEIREV